MADDADVIIVGAGLAGLVAAAELIDARKKVIVVDQEGEQSLGGQAFWSLGGLFLVGSPEQRRLGIRDSRELALADWLGTAAFDREEDFWPRQWAEGYVDFAAGEKRSWLRQRGIRFFPVVGWAERGGGNASGHGNSVPRFHLTWGTGPGVLAPFVQRAREGEKEGLLTFRFRHRVNELTVSASSSTVVRGDVLTPNKSERGQKTSRETIGTFELKAGAVVVASGGIGANHELVRKNWPQRLGRATAANDRRRAGLRGWPHAGDYGGRRWRRHQSRPDVALRRGHQELRADLDRSRHPYSAGAIVAVARCAWQAAAGAALSGLRYARHAQTHHGDRLRLFLVHPHARHHRKRVRAVGLRAKSRFYRQELAAGLTPRHQGDSRAGQSVHG